MTWRFSDGTQVELGGEVEGASLFAQELRRELARGDVQVPVWPEPSQGIPLDVNDTALMHAWLRHRSSIPSRAWMMVRMTDQPRDIPPLPPPPRGDEVEAPADAIY